MTDGLGDHGEERPFTNSTRDGRSLTPNGNVNWDSIRADRAANKFI